MEHSTEKTELPKRRVFHEHIILLIEGRLLMLLFVSTTGFIWYLFSGIHLHFWIKQSCFLYV